MSLQDKVAVVTGSGTGLGFAYAKALAEAGAAVVVNDVNPDAAASAAEAITAAGGKAHAVVAPVGSSDVAQELVDTAISKFGSVDIMVTNAGILRDGVIWKMTDDDFDQVINVHLRGTFTCVRAAAIAMRNQGNGGGRIICIGSQTGQLGNFGQANYTAAKAGILGLVRTSAMELAKAKITVNAIIPFSASPMTHTVPFLRDYVAKVENGEELPSWVRKAMGFGNPADVAGAVVFLASDAADSVTGQAVGVGGDRLSLWSHPAEIAVAFENGGWTSSKIAETWKSTLGQYNQKLGLPTIEEIS